MKNYNRVLIGKIYADWCGHCQTLKPEWQKMKQSLKKINPSIQIVEVEESDTEKLERIKKIAGGLKVNAYPTIFKYKGGRIEYYNGERLAKPMQSWALNRKVYRINGGKKNGKNDKNDKKTKKKSVKNRSRKNRTQRFFQNFF